MSRYHFIICSKDAMYGQNLLQKMKEIIPQELSFFLFHDIKKVISFSLNNSIKYLLIEENFPLSERNNIAATFKYILMDKLDKEMGPPTIRGPEIAMLKFQSASSMYRIIASNIVSEQKTSDALAKREKTSNVPLKHEQSIHNDSTKIIGIYSPIGRIGKTRFAIQLGKEYAQQNPTLYINMEEYAGETYFPGKLKENLGSLHYFAQQEEANIGFRLSTMVGQMGLLDYLEPIDIVKDLHEIKSKEWIELFNRILHEGIYKVIFLDIGNGINGLFEILRHCDVVYTHFLEDSTALSKLKNYHHNLIRTGYEDVLEHTIQKQVEQL